MSQIDPRGYCEFVLKPDARQFALLEGMLEGPIFLQRLLAMHGERLETIDEAASFLDRNWRRLVPYMFGRTSGQTPREMAQLILRLANDSLEIFRLDFAARCILTTTQGVLFPIPELATLTVADQVALADARQGMKHGGAFTLLRMESGYAVGIEFQKIVLPVRPASSECLGRNSRQSPPHPSRKMMVAIAQSKPRQKKIGMSAQEFLAIFNNRVTAHLRQQLAVSRQFTTTRFEDLSGWGVSGGLPSLPRRR